jgi:nitrate reductase gamma subunit
MSYLHELAFGIFPYIALAVFVIGSIIRFDYGQYTWRSGSSQMLRQRQFRIGSNLFHVGILLLFFGHLFGLLTPTWAYGWLMSSATKQMLAIVAGGLFGIVCLVGLVMLVHRRLVDPRIRATSAPMDVFILLLLLVQLLLGLLTIPWSLAHPDGSKMVLMSSWAQHILTFRGGAAAFLTDVAWVYKLHILLGLVMFLVFPFTRLVHIWSAPIWYIWRPYQVVRTRRRRPVVPAE